MVLSITASFGESSDKVAARLASFLLIGAGDIEIHRDFLYS
jgi:nucleotidyltransferase/DNA polymerase involved in DNA repair